MRVGRQCKNERFGICGRGIFRGWEKVEKLRARLIRVTFSMTVAVDVHNEVSLSAGTGTSRGRSPLSQHIPTTCCEDVEVVRPACEPTRDGRSRRAMMLAMDQPARKVRRGGDPVKC